MASVTAVIRFKDSASTLPDVIDALSSQTVQVERIIAVDTGSIDGSRKLLLDYGAEVIDWDKEYHHSKVLNFGLSKCTTPFTLCLSSHTVMQDRSTMEILLEQMEDEKISCCSIKWDRDPYYSDDIDWDELKEKGLKIGSIYTNSIGILRTALWREYSFDETIFGVEDYDWAVRHAKEGFRIRRIESPILYQRNAQNRELRDTARVFHIANRYGLGVTWLGAKGALRGVVSSLPGRLGAKPYTHGEFENYVRRLSGALLWRFLDLNK